MTAEEYLKSNKFQNPGYAGYYVTLYDAREAVKMARKEEREKLSWHDLRENPDDLPNNNSIVIVMVTDECTKNITKARYTRFAWIVDDLCINKVIAWMEIPKFE